MWNYILCFVWGWVFVQQKLHVVVDKQWNTYVWENVYISGAYENKIDGLWLLKLKDMTLSVSLNKTWWIVIMSNCNEHLNIETLILILQ